MQSRRRHVGYAIAVTAVVGLTGSLMMATASADDNDEPDAVAWGECPEGTSATVPLECATVELPLDYSAPDGETVEVMISRLPSANPEQRRGVLMLNPGGPGGSGLGQPGGLVDLGVPNSVLERYDLIGMDPRGVGQSTPVSCGFTADQDYRGNLPPYAVDDAAVTEQAEHAEAIAQQCADNDTEGLLPHISTANTARDMDAIRELLGEERLSFFGASYGSGLGAAYASMFPEESDRIVIDSNLGGTALDYDSQRRWGPGLEEGFGTFAEWAAERDGAYGLGSDAAAVKATYFELAERLDQEPMGLYDGPTFRFSTFAWLYSKSTFAPLAQLWQSVDTGDEDALREQLDELDAPVAAGDGDASEPSPYDNIWSSYLAVACNDTDWPEDVEFYREQVAADREAYPLFGAAAANITPCAFWAEPAEAPVEVVDEGPQNVLVVQNLIDVATPHEGAVIVNDAFGDRSRLVTADSFGHGTYVYGDNACALNVTTAFLVDGEMPSDDVFCEASGATGLDLDAEGLERRAAALEELTW